MVRRGKSPSRQRTRPICLQQAKPAMMRHWGRGRFVVAARCPWRRGRRLLTDHSPRRTSSGQPPPRADRRAIVYFVWSTGPESIWRSDPRGTARHPGPRLAGSLFLSPVRAAMTSSDRDKLSSPMLHPRTWSTEKIPRYTRKKNEAPSLGWTRHGARGSGRAPAN